jgi:hypothetical protein
MKWINLIRLFFMFAIVNILLSCEKALLSEPEMEEKNSIELNVSFDNISTRDFANNGTHNVNRILIIPFKKTDESLTNDDANFIPLYTLALQKDVTQFAVNNISLHLPIETTYKVLVIGYNQNDYDYNNISNPANRFTIGALTSPATLANFHLYPKSATAVPEFFSCICDVYDGATNVGTAFRPEQDYSLSGTLGRLVCGFSVTINSIPNYVKSISLVGENLTKVSKATDGSVLLSQVTGDDDNRLVEKQALSSTGTITFNKYFLPTFDTKATRFFLDVEYGSYVDRYTIKIAGTSTVVSTNNQFSLHPNHAINITGNFSQINTGFTLTYLINLDDNAWDGLQ